MPVPARDDAGRWHDFPSFVRAVFRSARPDPSRPVYGPPYPRPPLAHDPGRRVSLADDRMWRYCRALYPSPEQIEGQ